MKTLLLIALTSVLLLPKAFAQPATFTLETNELNLPALELVSGGAVTDVLNVTLTLQTSLNDILSFELTDAQVVSVDSATDRSAFATLDVDTMALDVPVVEISSGGNSLGQFTLGMELQTFLGTVFVFSTQRFIPLPAN